MMRRIPYSATGSRTPSHTGFTLVELVIVIAVTGVLAATLTIFFTPVVQSYFDVRRRAALTDAADTALRRMARDVRQAVPNSVRSPGNQCFELLPTSAGGRYRMAPDTVNDSGPSCAPSASCSAPLDTSQPSTGFDVLSPLSPVPAAGDLVVVGNHNPNDVYTGASSAVVTGVTSPNAVFGPHRISFAAKQFPLGYDGGRFSIVAGNGGFPAVFYVCSNADGSLDAQGNGKGTLYRLNRTLTAGYPSACPSVSGASVLATNVKSCNFVYSANSGTQHNGLVTLQIELAESNETVSLSYGAHVDNLP